MSGRAPPAPHRVLIVDDSEIFAQGLRALIETDPDLQVVGVARNGLEAVDLVGRLRPDVVTMDLRMPGLGGLEAIDRVMQQWPTPIVVLSGADELKNGELQAEIRRRGAVGGRPKPSWTGADGWFSELLAELKAVARRPVPAVRPRREALNGPRPETWPEVPVAALVASTGGPGILAGILAGLPAGFGAAVLVVQHIMPGFDTQFARFLEQRTRLPVRLARQGEPLETGVVLVAPDGAHLTVAEGARVHLDAGRPPFRGHRPSGTVLLESLALSHGPRAAGIILSGMGDDGSEGLLELRRAGGETVAQDGTTAIVDGMPRVARELGAAKQALPAQHIASFLIGWSRRCAEGTAR